MLFDDALRVHLAAPPQHKPPRPKRDAGARPKMAGYLLVPATKACRFLSQRECTLTYSGTRSSAASG
jgi:hypothetical protein